MILTFIVNLARQGSLVLCAPGDKKVRTLGTNLRSFELLLLYKETIFECQRTIIGVHKCMLQLLFPYFLTEYYPLSLPIFLIFLTHILDQSLADVNDKGKLSLSIKQKLLILRLGSRGLGKLRAGAVSWFIVMQ